MGYDEESEELAIPLKYVWKGVADSLYYVKWKTSDDKGNDNRFCGDIGWPCSNI
jgi:hypothetical protein